ncbi:MAG TPA: DNA adenine methylase [Acidimicrobiia bacterium]|nr:DNA adenine methylase [Acidimicrobiia bacterium]
MIKYIGSKRRLVPVLGAIATVAGARRALDLFTGTTRVAQELKRRGAHVTAVDTARYAEVFARCYVELDGATADLAAVGDALRDLMARPGVAGYFTETFCISSRFLQPHNGERVDAMRDAIERDYAGSWLYPVLLTSLIEAADRVDSTTGVQMAYVKQWADRSYREIELRVPELVAGGGTAVRADALDAVATLGPFDLAYLDPPYNQHRYFTNYHVWETLVAWDAPEHYGVACKRVDARDPSTKSVFNSRQSMPAALTSVIRDVDAALVVVSYNNESWVAIEELEAVCRARGGAVATLAFDSRRYVGAQIGIHSPGGKKVGRVSHLRNVEYVVCAGEPALVDRIATKGDDLWKLPATSHS